MRIAFVSEVFLPAVDGVVTRLTSTLRELTRAGDDVLMIAPAGGPDCYAGVPVVGARSVAMPLYPDGDGYPPKRVSLPQPMPRALRAYRPDVVHVINPVLLGVGGVAWARRHRIPLVASYHANLLSYAPLYLVPTHRWIEPIGWRYLRGLHNCAQVNLATSRATIGELRRHGIDRVELWPYGLDTDRFHPRHADAGWRARLSGGRTDRTVLLYVGRLAKEKTVHRLYEAVAGADDVCLAIVGDGPLRAELQRRFAGTATTFLGFLGGDDLARAFASADAFVLPSQTETLGLVTLEAHAAGLPVIAAGTPVARELVADGIDGLHYDAGRPGSLRAAVRRLASDPGLRAAMAVRARAAVAGATWEQATAILRRHYRTAIERSGPARAPAAPVRGPLGAPVVPAAPAAPAARRPAAPAPAPGD